MGRCAGCEGIWRGSAAGRQAGGRSECPQGEGTIRCQGHYHHARKRSGRYARRSRNGTPPQAGFVHGGSVQAAQGRGGRRARFRGQHRRTAHRRNAVRRPHQGHPTRCTGTGYAMRERSGHAVRCGCKHRMHRRNAAPVRVPRFAVCGEDKRCRQAACRPCQQRHGGYQG